MSMGGITFQERSGKHWFKAELKKTNGVPVIPVLLCQMEFVPK